MANINYTLDGKDGGRMRLPKDGFAGVWKFVEGGAQWRPEIWMMMCSSKQDKGDI